MMLPDIKRDRHRDLWTALRAQLMAQYTSDPATGGYGIYLVFWFGAGKIPRPPQGNPPTSPQELREQLEEDLTEAERRKISVYVVDVSATGGYGIYLVFWFGAGKSLRVILRPVPRNCGSNWKRT